MYIYLQVLRSISSFSGVSIYHGYVPGIVWMQVIRDDIPQVVSAFCINKICMDLNGHKPTPFPCVLVMQCTYCFVFFHRCAVFFCSFVTTGQISGKRAKFEGIIIIIIIISLEHYMPNIKDIRPHYPYITQESIKMIAVDTLQELAQQDDCISVANLCALGVCFRRKKSPPVLIYLFSEMIIPWPVVGFRLRRYRKGSQCFFAPREIESRIRSQPNVCMGRGLSSETRFPIYKKIAIQT